MFSIISAILILMSASPVQSTVMVNDTNDNEKVFVIQEQYFNDFDHLDLPATEAIVERGGIPAIQSIYGLKVKVASSSINEAGDQVVRLVRVDGGKFFYSHDVIEANLTKAIAEKELETVTITPASFY